MIKAQSVLAVFDALAENSLTIRSGPNRSSIIVSEMWTYFSFRAASAAPATANRLDDIRSALVRPGVASKAPARLMAANHRRYNCTCARTDRGAYRAANKSARQSAGSAAAHLFLRERAADEGHGKDSLVVGLEFTQPCLNTGKQVGLLAMGTTEWSDVTRQGGEALHVQINAGVDLVSGCWANKSQRRHYKPSMSRSSHSGMAKKKPRSGETGASFGSFGGNVFGESSPHAQRVIRLMQSVQILFPYDLHKKKLSYRTTAPAVGKRSIAFLGAPATSTLTSNATTVSITSALPTCSV